MSKNIAKDMRWHKDERLEDGDYLRHPADSIVWKEFDKKNMLGLLQIPAMYDLV